jgi:hypothetical protein
VANSGGRALLHTTAAILDDVGCKSMAKHPFVPQAQRHLQLLLSVDLVNLSRLDEFEWWVIVGTVHVV